MDIQTIKVGSSSAWKNDTMQGIEKYARERFIPVLLEDTATLLQDVLKKYQPKSILEIGTAIGYSGSLILTTCPDAHLTTLELDETSYKIAENHFHEFGLQDRVTQHLGNALDIIMDLSESKQYDFIFLDGPKGQYVKYLPYLKKMLKNGGVLFADNVLFKHMVDGPEFVPHKKRTIVVNLRKYLASITEDEELDSVIYDIGDGVAISIKR